MQASAQREQRQKYRSPSDGKAWRWGIPLELTLLEKAGWCLEAEHSASQKAYGQRGDWSGRLSLWKAGVASHQHEAVGGHEWAPGKELPMGASEYRGFLYPSQLLA